jgi:hypothetical protein
MKTAINSLILITIFCTLSWSNPLPPPPSLIISEIYFDGTEWTIEIVVGEFSINLDSFVLVSSSGEAFFKEGIEVEPGQVILITKDSLKTPLEINKAGDFISLKEYYNNNIQWELEYNQNISFGDYINSSCSGPFDGQSLVAHYISLDTPDENYKFYWLVKENSPSLGTNPNFCSSTDTVKGYILDKFDNPVKNAEISYIETVFTMIGGFPKIITNNDGYFEAKGMFSKYYGGKIIVGNSFIADITFKVELDSANLYNFKLSDYVYSGIKKFDLNQLFSIRNYPNPINDRATFEIILPEGLFYRNAVIKIYNYAGTIVDIIPVDKYNNNSNQISVEWMGGEHFAAGNYFYSLEIDNQKTATNKLIIVK